jgi:hypothetical protein
MLSTQLKSDDSVTLLEEILQLSAEIGVEGAVLFGALLLIYFVTGVLITTTTGLQTPYPFLSFESDPVLMIDSTIVGVFTVQGAGSLLLYHFSAGINDESLSSVVLSFIGLGVGGALLQMTLPGVLELIVSYV